MRFYSRSHAGAWEREIELEQDAIHVSEYWLQLPLKAILRAKLHKAIEEAKFSFPRSRVGMHTELTNG